MILLWLTLDDFERWRLFDAVFCDEPREGRGLDDSEPNVQPDRDHDDARPEWDTPPPG
jgi:hypothetical protein